MRRGVTLALALAWLLATPAAGTDAGLSRRLDAALADRALRGARIGVLVATDAGRELYARDADSALVPASNLKILTSLAALSALGPAHRIATDVFADAPPDAAGAVGVLAIRGGGDPALTSEELWRLASELRRAGLRRVRAGLLLDDSVFDAVRWHPSWGPASARAYHAPIGALSANYAAFELVARPGARPGDPVQVELEPPVDFLQLVNRARTAAGRGGPALVVDRGPVDAVERVTVSGTLPAAAQPSHFYRSVRDPLAYAGAVIRMQLEANGIRVEGPVRAGSVQASDVPLLRFEGKPLGEIVRLLLKYSSNPIAESLLKLLGARATGGQGTWENGVAAVRSELAAAGVRIDGLHMVDGSGLSYENRVPPETLVGALRLAADSFRFGPEFVAGLPIAAADGTLEKRADGAALAVRAKTGLLTRVTGLSGYARGADGERLVFSILVNGYRGSDEEAMRALDGFVAALVWGPSLAADQELRRERSP
jgi:D-alanyl-D-alanine carboxypeptidase/D-alanyl-D-alanine-endopeptidase (penicillin-binding protein 4)